MNWSYKKMMVFNWVIGLTMLVLGVIMTSTRYVLCGFSMVAIVFLVLIIDRRLK